MPAPLQELPRKRQRLLEQPSPTFDLQQQPSLGASAGPPLLLQRPLHPKELAALQQQKQQQERKRQRQQQRRRRHRPQLAGAVDSSTEQEGGEEGEEEGGEDMELDMMRRGGGATPPQLAQPLPLPLPPEPIGKVQVWVEPYYFLPYAPVWPFLCLSVHRIYFVPKHPLSCISTASFEWGGTKRCCCLPLAHLLPLGTHVIPALILFLSSNLSTFADTCAGLHICCTAA